MVAIPTSKSLFSMSETSDKSSGLKALHSDHESMHSRTSSASSSDKLQSNSRAPRTAKQKSHDQQHEQRTKTELPALPQVKSNVYTPDSNAPKKQASNNWASSMISKFSTLTNIVQKAEGKSAQSGLSVHGLSLESTNSDEEYEAKVSTFEEPDFEVLRKEYEKELQSENNQTAEAFHQSLSRKKSLKHDSSSFYYEPKDTRFVKEDDNGKVSYENLDFKKLAEVHSRDSLQDSMHSSMQDSKSSMRLSNNSHDALHGKSRKTFILDQQSENSTRTTPSSVRTHSNSNTTGASQFYSKDSISGVSGSINNQEQISGPLKLRKKSILDKSRNANSNNNSFADRNGSFSDSTPKHAADRIIPDDTPKRRSLYDRSQNKTEPPPLKNAEENNIPNTDLGHRSIGRDQSRKSITSSFDRPEMSLSLPRRTSYKSFADDPSMIHSAPYVASKLNSLRSFGMVTTVTAVDDDSIVETSTSEEDKATPRANQSIASTPGKRTLKGQSRSNSVVPCEDSDDSLSKIRYSGRSSAVSAKSVEASTSLTGGSSELLEHNHACFSVNSPIGSRTASRSMVDNDHESARNSVRLAPITPVLLSNDKILVSEPDEENVRSSITGIRSIGSTRSVSFSRSSSVHKSSIAVVSNEDNQARRVSLVVTDSEGNTETDHNEEASYLPHSRISLKPEDALSGNVSKGTEDSNQSPEKSNKLRNVIRRRSSVFTSIYAFAQATLPTEEKAKDQVVKKEDSIENVAHKSFSGKLQWYRLAVYWRSGFKWIRFYKQVERRLLLIEPKEKENSVEEEAEKEEEVKITDSAKAISRYLTTRDLDPKSFMRETLETILSATVRSFHNFTMAQRPLLCDVIHLERHPPGKMIIKEGHTSNAFYFILSGRLEILKKFNEKLTRVNMLGAGASFGLLTLSTGGNDKRTATVATMEYTELLRVDRKDYMPIAVSESKVREENKRKLMLLDDFENLPSEVLDKIVQFGQFVSFDPQQIISAEGTPNFQIMWVISGNCRCTRQVPFVKQTTGRRGSITRSVSAVLPERLVSLNQTESNFLVGLTPYDESRPLKQNEKLVNELLTIAELHPGDNFPHLPALGPRMDNALELLEAYKPKYSQLIRDDPPKANKVSLVATSRVEIMTMSQLEFVQIAPLGLINTLILQKRIFETPLEEVYKSLEVNNNWTANKQNVCVELITKTK